MTNQELRLKILSVSKLDNRLEIYVCFLDPESGNSRSHTLSIEEYIGDTQEEFADSLEALSKALRSGIHQLTLHRFT